jgi:hypothetical protein
VASGVKCGSHGGKNGETKSWTLSWLSLKTKVEPDSRGGQVMSGAGGHTKFAGFPIVHHKTTGLLG